ncbi:cytochrome b/b6 domain-containing protein [Polynucleobacter sp. CS-Odin-A6]|uniref:cytochrome b/b6 domain-containing protein n=1 Tax=Polynucleobacter sp. CS-Odin-A6 TaxID=2689106 RepID=UPI001C0DE76D|nr:cytochrome b/b6 domain-containing protein [Polynucleobacter sp. CS-Odin-A6]MBU3620001.1 cytochrome b/b6 domain-containing protein [Polynucleobacter sp. CS-Odin-A6]
MNTSNPKKPVLVWDFPVRVFHWLLVISFAGAWFTSEGESQQMVHYAFGYSACALVLFRVIWGMVGTRYARFTEFIKGPTETLHHLKSLFTGNQHLGLGHNPVGALVMISLMILILLIGLTGYWSVKEYLGEYMTGAHEAISSLALGFVAIHVAAAIIMSFLQKENLVKSMITGTKQGAPEQAIRYPMYLVGLSLVIAWAYSFYLVVNGSLQGLTQ